MFTIESLCVIIFNSDFQEGWQQFWGSLYLIKIVFSPLWSVSVVILLSRNSMCG